MATATFRFVDGLSEAEQREVSRLAGRARALYDALIALPPDDVEHLRVVWSEIVEIQDRVTGLLPPATNPL
jgi:hypothetical protein